MIKKIAIAGLIGLAVQAQAAVKTAFTGGGSDAASDTVVWTNLSGTVSVSTTTVGNPIVDGAASTFTAQDSGFGASISMDVVALSELGTPGAFDPATWSGGTNSGATIHTTSIGWGVNDSNGNGNLQVGEALILTFNFSGIAAGNEVKLLNIEASNSSLELWKQTSPSNGVQVATGSSVLSEVVTNGAIYALTGVGRIVNLTMDIAAPAAGVDQPTGLSVLSGDSVAVLDWDDDVSGFLDYYTVYRGTTSGTNNYDFSTNVTGSAFVDTGLSSGITYYYAVTAVGTNGTPVESAYSDEVSATPFTASTNVVLLQNLDATNAASVTVTNGNDVVSWADLSGNGNDAVDGDASTPVLWPSASLSQTGLAGMDMRTNSATLNLFSVADTDAFLNFQGGAVSNNGFCVMIAFKADNVQTSVAHQIVLANGANFDNLCLRLEQNGDLEALLDGVTVNNNTGMQDGDSIVMALNYKANSGWMEFWDSRSGLTGTATADVYGDFTSDSPLNIGGDHGSRFLDGMVGEVKIFSSYLDAATFQAEREALVAQWGSATADPYPFWAESYGLTNAVLSAYTNDVESDGLNNLLEYALGGNPTNNDAAALLPVYTIAADGGTNWFYHVHKERSGDDTLVYRLIDTVDLVNGPVNTNGYAFQTVGPPVGDYVTVTNSYSTSNDTLFVELKVEKP